MMEFCQVVQFKKQTRGQWATLLTLVLQFYSEFCIVFLFCYFKNETYGTELGAEFKNDETTLRMKLKFQVFI